MPVNRRVFLDIKSRTASGRLVIELFDEETPKATENFRALCTGEKGTSSNGTRLWYKGCPIHRIVPDFLIQGGDITKGDGTGGEAIYDGGVFEDENPGWHKIDRAGLVVSANQGTDLNTSQFFISCCPLPEIQDSIVFGQVINGLELIHKLEQVEVDEEDCPVESDRVTIVNCGQLEFKKSKKTPEPFVEQDVKSKSYTERQAPTVYEKEKEQDSNAKRVSEISVDRDPVQEDRTRRRKRSPSFEFNRGYDRDRSPGGGDYYRPNREKRRSRYETEGSYGQSVRQRNRHDDDRSQDPNIQFKGRGRMTYHEKPREYGRLS